MRKLTLILLCLIPLFGYSDDYTWWNTIHGWQPGMPSWRDWIHISPGFLGPNAMPVPDMKKGVVPSGTNLEFGMDFHFQVGDPTQDLSAKYYRSFADDRIAIELYSVIVEHFAMSDYIRDSRNARIFSGKGFADGDLYFTTLIQVIKDHKFPNTMFRMACRTASGSQIEGARYSDSPGYYFDLSFSKEYSCKTEGMSFMPYASAGFYSWQTNDAFNLQDDCYMYGLGADLKWKRWTVSNSLSGYSGYKHDRDRPMVYTFDVNHSLKKNIIRLQYLNGLRDWNYKTIKLSYIINLKKQPLSSRL